MMSLFPAYACGESNNENQTDRVHERFSSVSAEPAVTVEKEEELLKSDSSDEEVVCAPPEKKIKHEEDFFVDKSRDRANLHVSTLYPPGRPVYNCKDSWKSDKKKKREKRYFECNFKKISEKNYDIPTANTSERGQLNDFEVIGLKGEQFGDDRYEKVILEKTADYNKRLHEHPHDIELWIEFVNFQEERLLFDILQQKASSELSAREVCFTRQLAVLEKALEHNEGDVDLLRQKFEIVKLSRPANEYISCIKEEMKKKESEFLWSELLTAVQTISSMCSEENVRQMYVAALKSFAGNQEVAVRFLYRYGVFLRQAGLWEQLMLLLDLTCSMNMPPTEIFNKRVSQNEEENLAREEDKIISSGLPNHAIWCRIEKLRAGVHWRRPVSGNVTDDPQRHASPGLLADIITPITRPKELFTLAVNILRLMRIPLPNQTTSLLRCLDGQRCSYTDLDHAECLLSPVWGRPHVAKSATALLATVLDRPNYFTDEDGYLSFIEELFAVCSKWFENQERLAFRLWYINFNALLLTLNSSKSEAKRIRSSVQKLLKQSSTEPLLFCEFVRVEALTTTTERALHVLNTARSACRGVDKNWLPTVTVAQVDLMIENDVKMSEIPKLILECVGEEINIAVAVEKMSQKCEQILDKLKNDSTPISPHEHLIPSDDISFWHLHLELLSIVENPKTSIAELEKLEKYCSTNHNFKLSRLFEEVTARVIKRNGFNMWTNNFNVITKYMNKYPRNSLIASKYLDKSVHYKPIPISLEGFSALLISELDRESSDRRVLHKLRRVTDGSSYGTLKSCPIIWRLRLEFEGKCGNISSALYKAIDDCAGVKSLYISGCLHNSGKLSELTDLILEKGLRLHALPDELAIS